MKQRTLLLGLGFMAAFGLSAATSPYTGSPAADGTYYLYQVETGKWLQANNIILDQWTTHAQISTDGFDVQLSKPEGFEGFKMFCNFTGNGCLNGADQDRFYLDQSDRDETDWIFEPVSVDGVTNAYKIMAKATPEGTGDRSAIANDVYIGARDGELSDDPTDFTWQLVSREERIAKMIEAAKTEPQDASWLIPWFDMGRNDMRDRIWKKEENNPSGGGMGFGGKQGFPIKEAWHMCTMRWTYTLEDLPTGTYNFTVQGFQRDGDEQSEDTYLRYINGESVDRVFYFAGASRGAVMSSCKEGRTEPGDGFGFAVPGSNESLYIPNSMDDAGTAMFNGAYKNEWIQASVTDGSLVVGVEKTGGEHHDWFVLGRFFLQFVSSEAAPEDLTALKDQLASLVEKSEALPSTPTFAVSLAAGKAALEAATSSTALMAAIDELQSAYNQLNKAKDAVASYLATKDIALGLGLDVAEAEEKFNTAVTEGEYKDALNAMRYARRRHVAETHENIFEGSAPANDGKYYIYNVGQKQFLTGGSDWGAHAALGMPGHLFTLMAEEAEADQNWFHIETGLYNGDDKHFLGYRGYLDTSKAGAWLFDPVPGKDNVYWIKQADYPDVHVQWNPYASVDQHMRDETTVGTENRNLDPENLDAQWILVTPEERNAFIAKASLENPVDVSYFITNPNFCQRADMSQWSLSDFSVWALGTNYNDFAIESWNSPAQSSLIQFVEGLPQGVYVAYVDGYYRPVDFDGMGARIAEVKDVNSIDNVIFFAGNGEPGVDETSLHNILDFANTCPGEGQNVTDEETGEVYNIPNTCHEATAFFRTGMYQNHVTVNFTSDQFLLGIEKLAQYEEKDWIVLDNFRIVYYGPDATVEEVEGALSGIDNVVVDSEARPEDNRIFNLQGIQVQNPSAPGVYIRNGKKFLVR